MAEIDSHVFIEDLIFFAMRMRNKDWHRILLNIKDDDPDFRRIFTPEIGKAVLYFAKEESWCYMDVVDFLTQELLLDRRFCFGKFTEGLRVVGEEFLDLNREDTLFSYCALIVEVCCYCLDNKYQSLIEAAVLAASMAINVKLNFAAGINLERYHHYAVEYNTVHEETFRPDETNLTLNIIYKKLKENIIRI